MFFAFSFYCAKGRVVQYNIIKENPNYYDKEMQSFTGWKGWNNTYEGGGRSYYGSTTFSFSQNAARYNDSFTIFKDGSDDYESKNTIIYTFIGDEPTTEFLFRKKISIKGTSSLKNPDKPQDNYNIEIIGSGYIYSSASYESIMSGNSTADIYVYFEMSNGFKGYIGRNINRNTQYKLDEIKAEKEEADAEAEEEAEDAKREK